MVDQKLEKLINSIQKEHSGYFIKATQENVDKLRRLLHKYDVEKVIDFYSYYQPNEMPMITLDTYLLNIDGILYDSFYDVIGNFISKFGVFPFASTVGGNLICFDANDVVNGEPSVLYADNNFCSYNDYLGYVAIGVAPVEVVKRKGTKLILNYENIKDCLFKFEERFSDFFVNLLQDKYGYIEDYVYANRGEYF